MKNAIRIITILIFTSSLFLSCGKDDPINPELTLYKRLSKGDGVWKLVRITDYIIPLTNGKRTQVAEQTPDVQYIFYERGIEAFGQYISPVTATIASKDSAGNIAYTHYDIWAEQQRVQFNNPNAIIPQTIFSFTVLENKSRKQVWERFENASSDTIKVRQIELDYCRSCEPYLLKVIQNRI